MKTKTFAKTLPNEFEDPSVFCASQEGFDFGTCKGDSGGPIRVFDDSDWKFRQIGVVHGSAASCDGSRFPGIFVRLDDPEVLNFIQREVFGTSSCKVIGKSMTIHPIQIHEFTNLQNHDSFVPSVASY